MEISVFTIGGGDLLEDVFNAVAALFNNKAASHAITSLAVMFGGLFAVFEFSKSRDIKVLLKWAGMYVLITSLMVYPRATVHIEDYTGIDRKPRAIDNVPFSLAIFASFTSRIGIGLTEIVETVFHHPEDMTYQQTGMLMGSKLVLASKNFQITDADFSNTLNEFMQQCVFFDLLLRKYTVQELVHADDPWKFIQSHTSVARAFPLDGVITICNVGASKLGLKWTKVINDAASIYGGQILGNGKQSARLLLSHLGKGYHFLTEVSKQGEDILKTNLLANALSNALSHNSANANAPAALLAYEDTKTELQIRETFIQTGKQAGIWMQYYKNIIEAVLYGAFIFIYFLSYFPFGGAIVRNYLSGLFVLQTFAPMYALINFAFNSYAQNRSSAFISSDTEGGLSIANIAGITAANADAMAAAGYLMWPLTLGGAILLFRGLPSGIQSMGQLLGGVAQHAGSHVIAESIGGNISTGNANFGNRSLNNTTANHWDTNMRYAAGGATFQTGTGSSVSITADGSEVMDNRGALSNLGVSVQMTKSIRSAASRQAQSSMSAAINKTHAAGEQYAAGIREIEDFSKQQSNFKSSGDGYSTTETTGVNKSAHTVSQLVDTWRKDHHVSHERASQLFGQVYADIKGGFTLLGNGGGFGAQASASTSGRSAFGSLYNDAHQYAVDNNFVDAVDSAKRTAIESHYRDSSDKGSRFANSIVSSFDKGDHFRHEAASQLSEAESYSTLASQSTESASSTSANYTQEFYKWMRHQPSPSPFYGQGTMSRSAIDNMAAHDTAHLQDYTNRFADEKISGINAAFEKSHHLNHGKQSIHQVYDHNNHVIEGQSELSKGHEQYHQQVENKMRYVTLQGDGVGVVGESNKKHAENTMKENENKLNEKHETLTNRSLPLHEKIDKKVKGQMLESINLPDSLTEDSKNTKSFINLIRPQDKNE
jgi:conjugal transfer mating pair stabilization protein TraG